jgi:hypothetical protein
LFNDRTRHFTGAVGSNSPLELVAAGCWVLGIFSGSNAGQAIAGNHGFTSDGVQCFTPPQSAAGAPASSWWRLLSMPLTDPAALVIQCQTLSALTDVAPFSRRVTTYTLLLYFTQRW